MKCVMLSIRPQWCEKICHVMGKDEAGKPIYEKRIEVRKTAPKCEVPFKCYIYCTKAKSQWRFSDYEGAYENSKGEIVYAQQHIIGEFICRGIMQPFNSLRLMAKESCLTEEELVAYSNGKPLYGWHISDLKLYDKPRTLSEFKTPPCEKNEKACGNCKWLVKINTPDVYECECYAEDGRPLTRPPQSYMFVEEVENE